MAQVDFKNREIAIKLVYYGPALSGKTTNLQQIHARMDQRKRGRLLTLDTKEDRTLYFDLLPLAFKSSSGMTVKVKLFTVPGQVIHNTTRKVVLQGVDGIAFIADSQIAETKNNNESFANLRQNLKDNRLDKENIPIVIQFNKRDLPKVRSDDEISKIATRGKEPVFRAVAIKGEGVVETFLGLAASTWDALEQRMGLGSKHGLPREELLSELGKQLGAAAPARTEPAR
ncbi:MAG TPA: ADP-ribosylation factor-like protein [Polyangia bacterium]|nr:ADP-ribosylation factor-like protein [Polyangia bacterium]